MTCPQCGAETTGARCSYCGHQPALQGSAGARGGAGFVGPGAGQPTARDAEWQAAMRQPTARDPEWRAAMGQPTAADPQWQSAMSQPKGGFGPTPAWTAPGGMQNATGPLAKRGCCGCLPVVTLALVATGALAALLLIAGT